MFCNSKLFCHSRWHIFYIITGGQDLPTLTVAPQHRVYFFVDRIYRRIGHPSSLAKVTIRFSCVKKASEDGKYQKHVKIYFWKKKIQHTKVLSKCCISDWGGVRREEGPIQKYSYVIPNLQRYLELVNFIRLSNLWYSVTFSIVENCSNKVYQLQVYDNDWVFKTELFIIFRLIFI